MRILFIGNGNLKFAGLRHFGIDTRIFNGLVRNGHAVYFFSDRDVARQASPLGIKPLGAVRANREILRVAENFRPEAIVIAHVDIVTVETIAEIKRRFPDLRVAHVNVDALFSPKNVANLLKRRDVADATFVTTGGPALNRFASATNPCYFAPNITDRSIDTGRAFENDNLTWDVSCFMNVNPEKPADENDRVALANGVAAGVSGLRVFYRGFNGMPGLRGLAYIESNGQAAMGLNLSKHTSDGLASTPETRHLYSSDRIAHIMGNGSLALIEDDFGLKELYGEDEAVFFHALPDLIEKVSFYKGNSAARRVIAEKGWRKAQEEFNETMVMQYVIERLFEKPLAREYAWPTTAWRGENNAHAA